MTLSSCVHYCTPWCASLCSITCVLLVGFAVAGQSRAPHNDGLVCSCRSGCSAYVGHDDIVPVLLCLIRCACRNQLGRWTSCKEAAALARVWLRVTPPVFENATDDFAMRPVCTATYACACVRACACSSCLGLFRNSTRRFVMMISSINCLLGRSESSNSVVSVEWRVCQLFREPNCAPAGTCLAVDEPDEPEARTECGLFPRTPLILSGWCFSPVCTVLTDVRSGLLGVIV